MNKIANFILAYEPFLVVPFATLLIVNSSISWVGLLALAPLVLRWRTRGYLTVHTQFDLPFALFFLGILIGLYPSADLRLSIEAFRGYLGSVVIYYAIVNNATPRYMKFWVVAIAGALLLGTLFTLTVPTKVTSYNAWIFDLAKVLPKVEYLGYSPHMNNLAGVLSVFVAIMAGVVLFSTRLYHRAMALAIGLPFGLVVLLTSSRAGWIGLGFAFILLTVRRNRWFLLAMLGCFTFVGLALSSGVIASKELLEIGSGTTLINRTQLWASTLDMLGDMPFTGVGLGAFPLVYRLYVSPAQPYVLTHPHNSILQVYTDTGIFGMLSVVVGAFIVARLGFRLLRTSPSSSQWYGYSIGSVAGFVALLVHGFFESSGVAVAADAVGNYHYTVIPTVFVLAGLLIASIELCTGKGNNAYQAVPSSRLGTRIGQLIGGSNLSGWMAGYSSTGRKPVFAVVLVVTALIVGNGSGILGGFFRNLGDVELTKALLQEGIQNQQGVGRFDLASRLLKSASDWEASDLRVLRSLGRIRFEQRDYDGAADILVRYLDKRPDDAIARTQLGFAYIASGQEEKANQEWLLGGTAGYFYEEAKKSLQGQDFPRAFELADRAVKLSPQLPGPLYVRGRALTFMGRIAEAASSLRLSVELYDYLGESGPESLLARGHYYSLAGGWKKSLPAFEAVVQHKNSTVDQKFEAFEGMGKVYYRGLDKPTEAIESYYAASVLAPRNMWELLNIGDILRDEQDAEGAREWYKKAERLAPDSDEISHRVALSYVVEGRVNIVNRKWNDALEAFAMALEMEPDLAAAHFGAGEALLMAGESLPDAEGHFLQMVQGDPAEKDLLLRSYMYLSDIAQMTGRQMESKEWAAKAEFIRSH